jgi:23S rRNA pseudouridine1911/1915/1917 synthase
LPPKRHFLHAAWLIFRHPVTGAEIELRSALPPDLRGTLTSLLGEALPRFVSDPLEFLGFFASSPSTDARRP